MDVDTRLLRYFAAVADEGNLSRAAERLFVSQPTLTKQIRQLERALGAVLFTRSRAGMALTEAGRALAARVPELLAGWDEVAAETRRAAGRASRVLRVGFLASAANEATRRIIVAFRERRPDWRVEMVQSSWGDPTAGLAGGGVGAALVRLPFPGQDGLRVEELFSEPRLLAVHSAHPLAARDRVDFAELLDEPFVAAPVETGAWRDFWLASERRGGRPPVVGAVTDQPDAWLSAIANGDGVALAPESAARFYARPGITYLPVDGVEPTRVGVAWTAAGDADAVVRDFVACCLEVRTGA
ncbi:LysR family transcriptional regulator [Phytomonospora endophytica]|uniref:DNA-binding transcriptional LysR family regulator n=1 Tax=Phytomonospora endophytica TaxID=714109 RepID=A0A841FXV2_9ACTN|nr:LysR family transcriptional regulator [Phytomonospora endophytica]MBB6036800.1 DNA-binding transcriptional LysR family regulator [Phytomonospora endophytica]GIG68166.1 LysR family transcriptional regulator [Phytomonospora endophytica]